jgi:hypothetical protein
MKSHLVTAVVVVVTLFALHIIAPATVKTQLGIA